MNKHSIPKLTMILNSLILTYVFGRAFTVSLFETGKHYVTKTSILLAMVIIIGFVGLHFATRNYMLVERDLRISFKRTIILNVVFILLVFLMLLEGVLIV